MKRLLQWKLKILAKLYLWRYRPRVVGITGSVGKTSTKDAVGLVLANKFKTRISSKSYNNQIGLPLTILGFETVGRSILGWLGLLFKALGKIIYDANYPQVLVLEMGADQIGDLNYLISIVKPNISVITNIGPVHLQSFKTLEKVAKEKAVLVKKLTNSDWAILNYDDKRVRAMANETKAKKIFYGLDRVAEIRASDIKIINKNLIFNICDNNQIYNLQLRGVGEHLIYSILAAFCVGQIFKIEPKEIIRSLVRFQPLAGRGQFLDGKFGSFIIDESYNASPMSMNSALKFLHKIKTDQSKVVILGDMRELGKQSLKFHQALGDKLDFVDQIILVGSEIKPTYEILKHSKSNLSYFEDVKALQKELKNLIKPNSLILVKGSQIIRLEKIVEKLISSKYNKKDILVRQSEEWNK